MHIKPLSTNSRFSWCLTDFIAILQCSVIKRRELMEASNQNNAGETRKTGNFLKTFFIFLLALLVCAAISIWAAKVYFFPSEFRVVKLKAQEEQVLDQKLEQLTGIETLKVDSDEAPKPEKYEEKDSDREVEFSEKELNALIARNKDLAKKLAVDLSEDMLSANLLVPLDEDFPIFGGNTLKLKGGLELSYANNNPVVIVKGLSIMGVPVPNAWMGGIKNIDLISEFGEADGFWKSFGDGVENIEVKDGSLKVKLRA